jgi:hypothetical protein
LFLYSLTVSEIFYESLVRQNSVTVQKFASDDVQLVIEDLTSIQSIGQGNDLLFVLDCLSCLCQALKLCFQEQANSRELVAMFIGIAVMDFVPNRSL